MIDVAEFMILIILNMEKKIRSNRFTNNK